MNQTEIITQQTTVATSTKIALGFMVATGLLAVSTFAAAALVTLFQPSKSTSTKTVPPSLTAAPDEKTSQVTINGVTYTQIQANTNP